MMAKTVEDWVAYYRAQADECREEAAKAETELLRFRWLKFADDWIKLAEKAEQSRE